MLPSLSDLLKMTCNIGASSLLAVFSIIGLSWSGPAALCGRRLLRSFSIPFVASLMLGIFPCGLYVCTLGDSGSLSALSWSFILQREDSEMGDLDVNTDWNCLFRTLALSWSDWYSLLLLLSASMPPGSCFECFSSVYSFLLFGLVFWSGSMSELTLRISSR